MRVADDGSQHVLYRHWGKDGKLLYAGMTNNPPARLRKHRTEAEWWALVKWTSYERFPSRETLKEGETWAIQHENPEHNIQERVYDASPRESLDPGTDKYLPITTRDLRLSVKLVHPLSQEFWVYGGDDTLRRAREWALARHYYLLDSGPRCAHVFYLTECPNGGGVGCLPLSDHTRVWVPALDAGDFNYVSRSASPFILTQPYKETLDERIPADLSSYAKAHGLDVATYDSASVSPDPFSQLPVDYDWYYPGRCVPIRLSPLQNNTMWPLEIETTSLMFAWRDDWPEKVPEWLT